MAGGGVGEAMLISAAVGAGTGAIGSAVQNKDPLKGALMGGVLGATTGGLGAAAGGAASTVGENLAANAAETTLADAAGSAGVNAAENSAIGQITAQNAGMGLNGAEQTANVLGTTNAAEGSQAATLAAQNEGMGLNQLQSNANIMDSITPGTTNPQTAGPQTWGAQGKGTGFFPGMTNGQVAGAATAGGISGLASVGNQGTTSANNPNAAPYNGPLSRFKYNPGFDSFKYNPGFAEGGVAGLANNQNYPQGNIVSTQFATPTQQPASQEILRSDYDTLTNPYTGEVPRFGNGGGIGFIRSLQPGGQWGDMTSDMYGAVQEQKPGWLQNMEPGGFIGATVPGKMDYEDKKRAEEEAKAAEAKQANQFGGMQIALMSEDEKKKREQMNQPGYASLAQGGISSLGAYSDGGRMLRGPGDGMSDSIPGTISGKQPARLADGEFVVPADVVSHLGNGSTDAGAKKLYGMMDSVRKARTGSKKQGKQINANKHIPGMSDGGIASFATGNLVVNPDTNEIGYWAGASGSPFTGDWTQGTWTPVGVGESTPNQNLTVSGQSTAFKPSGFDPNVGTYSEYTKAHRPSFNDPQNYGDIYQSATPDYSTPGYTLAGSNLNSRWNNIAGEGARAARPASLNQQTTQAYLQSLGRAPDKEGFNYWLNSGLSGPQISNAIRTSAEAKNLNAPVMNGQPTNEGAIISDYYQKYLNRAPEESGMNFWQSQLGENATQEQVQNAIMNSPEAQQYEQQYISNLYNQYLGRAPEESGLSYWQNQMQGTTNQQDIAKAIQATDEAKAYAQSKNQPEKKDGKYKGGIAALRRA